MATERDFKPLFTWRSAVCDSKLPATCRHVLLTLSLHMNERGGSCFPSTGLLASETGLNRATVIRQLQHARDNGWLVVGQSRGRASNTYTAAIPPADQPSRKATVAQDDSRTEQQSHTATVADDEPNCRSDEPQPSLCVDPTVAQDDTSSSVSASVISSRGLHGFDDFWAVYPRRSDKAAAKKAFDKAIKITNVSDILEGAQRYADDPNRDPEFTKHAATWLNHGCWEDEPLPPRRGTRSQENAASAAKVVHAVTTIGNPLLAIGAGR